ncbi:MAG: hypothetical protein ABW032_10480 [Burkholderiaceae bacterium]
MNAARTSEAVRGAAAPMSLLRWRPGFGSNLAVVAIRLLSVAAGLAYLKSYTHALSNGWGLVAGIGQRIGDQAPAALDGDGHAIAPARPPTRRRGHAIAAVGDLEPIEYRTCGVDDAHPVRLHRALQSDKHICSVPAAVMRLEVAS